MNRSQSQGSEWSEREGGRAGYLLLQEKKAFGTTWSKHYAVYSGDTMRLGADTLLPVLGAERCEEERRFCWELQVRERPALTLQALSQADREGWLRAIQKAACDDPGPPPARPAPPEERFALDEKGFEFVRSCISEVESRGLQEQGLYRVAGVSSRVARVLAGSSEPAELAEHETRTLASALKGFLRGLPQPLLTHRLHAHFIQAAKLEPAARLAAVEELLRRLPRDNLRMLSILLAHLRKVAAHSAHNLMTPSNLAVCFGPTLVRPPQDTVADILDLKFCNLLVETLIEHAHSLPLSAPPRPGPAPQPGPQYAPPHAALLQQLAPAARVRTLYACLGESDGELSFEPNQIITDVSASGEPGWLRGVLHGRAGLVPENYVEQL